MYYPKHLYIRAVRSYVSKYIKKNAGEYTSANVTSMITPSIEPFFTRKKIYRQISIKNRIMLKAISVRLTGYIIGCFAGDVIIWHRANKEKPNTPSAQVADIPKAERRVPAEAITRRRFLSAMSATAWKNIGRKTNTGKSNRKFLFLTIYDVRVEKSSTTILLPPFILLYLFLL